MEKLSAKQCALISVEEILKAISEETLRYGFMCLDDDGFGLTPHEFYTRVKEELQSL